MKKKNIAVGVTASVACYKALDIIRGLKKNGLSTEAVMTKEAEEFIRPILFQSISGNKVIVADLFKVPEEWDTAHVSLAKRADLVLVAPATANIIAKVANGICDDMLTCTICATKAPVLFAPAMNANMYANKIVQENISKLKNIGYHFIGPIKGKLVCGEEGIGHLEDVEKIVNKVRTIVKG
ncbi:MAG: flavoprotein [Candidatus Omnitrophota bacterium]|jgi:phosphopantothenoylcysteine decarboxylase/phosphopantothenate--cysteine ligase|nr:flavoprotein [Candidatus Omnitrophota bacterium]